MKKLSLIFLLLGCQGEIDVAPAPPETMRDVVPVKVCNTSENPYFASFKDEGILLLVPPGQCMPTPGTECPVIPSGVSVPFSVIGLSGEVAIEGSFKPRAGYTTIVQIKKIVTHIGFAYGRLNPPLVCTDDPIIRH